MIVQDGNRLVKYNSSLEYDTNFNEQATKDAIGRQRTFGVVTFNNGEFDLIGTFGRGFMKTFYMNGDFHGSFDYNIDRLRDFRKVLYFFENRT